MEFTESKQMLLEADRTGSVKIMVPVEELRSLLQVVEEQKKGFEAITHLFESDLHELSACQQMYKIALYHLGKE